jgi:predicted acyl esterase
METKEGAGSIFSGDSYLTRSKSLEPVGQRVAYGTDVKGLYFDGYPQIVKQEGSKPEYEVKVEKDIMVSMRDGIRLATDVYRPDAEEGRKFPALLCFGPWGKDIQ